MGKQTCRLEDWSHYQMWNGGRESGQLFGGRTVSAHTVPLTQAHCPITYFVRERDIPLRLLGWRAAFPTSLLTYNQAKINVLQDGYGLEASQALSAVKYVTLNVASCPDSRRIRTRAIMYDLHLFVLAQSEQGTDGSAAGLKSRCTTSSEGCAITGAASANTYRTA